MQKNGPMQEVDANDNAWWCGPLLRNGENAAAGVPYTDFSSASCPCSLLHTKISFNPPIEKKILYPISILGWWVWDMSSTKEDLYMTATISCSKYCISWKRMFPNQPTPGTDLTKPTFPWFQIFKTCDTCRRRHFALCEDNCKNLPKEWEPANLPSKKLTTRILHFWGIPSASHGINLSYIEIILNRVLILRLEWNRVMYRTGN